MLDLNDFRLLVHLVPSRLCPSHLVDGSVCSEVGKKGWKVQGLAQVLVCQLMDRPIRLVFDFQLMARIPVPDSQLSRIRHRQINIDRVQ